MANKAARLRSLVAGVVRKAAPVMDVASAPVSAGCLAWLAIARRVGNARLPLHRSLYKALGVYPVIDHYYEPRFTFDRRGNSARQTRRLPGIDWNDAHQLQTLATFCWQDELSSLPLTPANPHDFHYHNGSFGFGDAEFLYNMIRTFKPRRIIEIGSGNSTLMAVKAVAANASDDGTYRCDVVCVEPYEHKWLSHLPVRLIRQRMEDLDPQVFLDLGPHDILFIDSSHIIRPQGDVLFQILEILPRLQPGVFVHIHDVFSPNDYPDAWLVDEMRLWNEQYLVEAFLSCNSHYRIVGALNYLWHHHRSALTLACPMLRQANPGYEPGSLWLQRLPG